MSSGWLNLPAPFNCIQETSKYSLDQINHIFGDDTECYCMETEEARVLRNPQHGQLLWLCTCPPRHQQRLCVADA